MLLELHTLHPAVQGRHCEPTRIRPLRQRLQVAVPLTTSQSAQFSIQEELVVISVQVEALRTKPEKQLAQIELVPWAQVAHG